MILAHGASDSPSALAEPGWSTPIGSCKGAPGGLWGTHVSADRSSMASGQSRSIRIIKNVTLRSGWGTSQELRAASAVVHQPAAVNTTNKTGKCQPISCSQLGLRERSVCLSFPLNNCSFAMADRGQAPEGHRPGHHLLGYSSIIAPLPSPPWQQLHRGSIHTWWPRGGSCGTAMPRHLWSMAWSRRAAGPSLSWP